MSQMIQLCLLELRTMKTMYAFCKCFVKGADTVYQQTLMRHPQSSQKTVIVDFSIALSPTYQVPVLWFTPNQLLLNGPWGLDTVYQYLVPTLQKDQVRQVGILGGISMAVLILASCWVLLPADV
jgi:Autophagocytosis associated protein, active-site domain